MIKMYKIMIIVQVSQEILSFSFFDLGGIKHIQFPGTNIVAAAPDHVE